MKCVPIAVCMCMYINNFLVCTHTEVTNTMSTVYTTPDYEYRQKNKGTGLVLVLRKCGVYQESYKMCTVSINMKYTQNVSSCTQTELSHRCYVHCLDLDYEYRH